MNLRLPFKRALISLMIMTVDNAWAIGGENLPGPALPEQVSKNLTSQQPAEQTQGAPGVMAPKEKAPSPLGAEAQKIKFKLNGVILEGNRTYSTEELRPLYADKIGKVISVADLFTIVQNITNYYRNNGYIISRAILPPQHVKNGVVRIRIIEGFIDKVDVSGDPKGARCLVLAYGRKIAECRPLEIKRMENYLLLANEIPGTQVRAVLAPSKKTTGAADLTLATQNTPIMGYVSYDNYGTRYIGPQQMTGNMQLNSMVASGDATQFTYTKTPKGGELNYYDLNYTLPVGDDGIRWQFGDTRAHTHPLFVLRPSQIDGLNVNYYTMVTYPYIRTRTESLTFRTGFNYLDSEVTTFDQQLYTDHLRNLDLGLTYNFSDRWYGANLISSDFRQGLPILGYTSNTNPQTAQTSRPGGRGDYTKITLMMSRLQAVKGPFSIYGAISGQWAFNPVLASEQYTFGGPIMGRGYDVAELIGDKGIGGSIEGRYDWAYGTVLQNLQLYVFYDAGEIWNYKNIGGTPRKVSGTSTGVGTRFFFTKYVSGNLMWTQTLTKQVAAEQLIGDGARPRVFFSVVASLG